MIPLVPVLGAAVFGAIALAGKSRTPTFPRGVGTTTYVQYPGFAFVIKKVGAARYDLDFAPVRGAPRQLLATAPATKVRWAVNTVLRQVNDNLARAGRRESLEWFGGEDGFGARSDIYRIQPYRKGHGPTVSVVLSDYPEVYAVQNRKRTLVFKAGPYRPGPFTKSRRQMADDIISFATTYAERPDEFDRPATAPEQIHRAWWARHGDVLSAEVGPR